MPRSAPLLRDWQALVIARACPDARSGKSGRRLTAVLLRPCLQQPADPMFQTHAFSADFGISEITLDGGVGMRWTRMRR
jgi:hypothetical protein